MELEPVLSATSIGTSAPAGEPELYCFLLDDVGEGRHQYVWGVNILHERDNRGCVAAGETKVRLFLGSTREAVHLVDWASKYLTEEFRVEVVPWNSRIAFPRGEPTLLALQAITEQVDGAILFVTGDDITKSRGQEMFSPRDNIVLEAGLFLGALGEKRTALVVEKGVRVKIPSDLQGITFESFQATDQDPGITLRDTFRSIVQSLDSIGPTGYPTPFIRQLQRQGGIFPLNSAVGEFRRSLEEAVYPKAESSSAGEVDVMVAYHFEDVARRISRHLQRPEFRLRVCVGNMWDEQLAEVYLRKYRDRTLEHMQNAITQAITILLGPVKRNVTKGKSGRMLAITPQSVPQANVEIYITDQRVTQAYYRIDGFTCVVPLDIKRSAEPQPMSWSFERDQQPSIFGHYKLHFEAVLEEATRVFPGR